MIYSPNMNRRPFANSKGAESRQRRPDCMKRLGIAPPYRLEDVKQAYLAKSKIAHPDLGGSQEEFQQLHAAFEEAKKYAAAPRNMIDWLAAQVRGYVQTDRLEEHIRRLGGKASIRSVDWLRHQFGEGFAQLLNRAEGIELHGPTVTDETIKSLVKHEAAIQSVTRVDLSFSGVTDEGVIHLLGSIPNLRELDLERTDITAKSLFAACRSPQLWQLHLRDTQVRWWHRLYARAKYSRILITS